MAYIAFLDSDNVVTQVVKSPDDSAHWVTLWSNEQRCRCIETCRNGSFRHRYANPGFTYYEDIDAFVEPAPYPSWSLNKKTITWEPPVPMPSDTGESFYVWDEETVSWKNLGPDELLETGAGDII